MPFYVLGLLLIGYSVINFKKSLFLFITFKFFLSSNITVISIPGIPILSLDLFLTMWFFVRYLFLLNRKKIYRAKISFPWLTPFILITISNFISAVFSIATFGSEMTTMLKELFLNVFFLVMMWEVIESDSDFRFLYKVITIVIFISCLYGFIEYLMGFNPLTLYEWTLNKDSSRLVNTMYELNARGYRINSIFEHCLGAGINWSMYAVFTLVCYVDKNKVIEVGIFNLAVALMSIVCVFLTKMRSGLIFFVISALCIVKIRKNRFYTILLLGCAGLVLVLLLGLIPEEVELIIKSIFSNKAQNQISGSTFDMRIDQFAAALELLKISPIVGLGDRFQDVMVNGLTKRLFGSESIWLLTITRRGLIGIVAQFVYFMYSIVKIPRRWTSNNAKWFMIAYCLTYSVTTMPGIILPFFYWIVFFFIKNSSAYIIMPANRVNEWSIEKTKIIHRKIY